MGKNGFLSGRFFGVAGFAGLLGVVFVAGGCGETMVYKQNQEFIKEGKALREENAALRVELAGKNASRDVLPMTPPAPTPAPAPQADPDNSASTARGKPLVSIGG